MQTRIQGKLPDLTVEQLRSIEVAMEKEWERRIEAYASCPELFAQDVRGFSDDLLYWFLLSHNLVDRFERYDRLEPAKRFFRSGLQMERARRDRLAPNPF
jgi:hypothetical protein